MPYNSIRQKVTFNHLGNRLIYFDLDKDFRRGGFFQYGFKVQTSIRNTVYLLRERLKQN